MFFVLAFNAPFFQLPPFNSFNSIIITTLTLYLSLSSIFKEKKKKALPFLTFLASLVKFIYPFNSFYIWAGIKSFTFFFFFQINFPLKSTFITTLTLSLLFFAKKEITLCSCFFGFFSPSLQL